MKSEAHDHSIEINEYSVLVSRLNSVDAWSHRFVSLFFVFIVALMTGVGFLQFKLVNNNESVISFYFFTPPLDKFLVGLFTILGLSLTVWAILMLVHYQRRSTDLIRRIAELEKRFYGAEEASHCFGNLFLKSRKGPLNIVTFLSVASVMLIFLAAWGVLFISLSI